MAYPSSSQSGASIPSGILTAEPVSKVLLRVQCSNLLNKDVLSKSDPMVVLSMLISGYYKEIGRTENIKNCLNPSFLKPFEVDYFFEEVQKLRFHVYDLDNNTPQLEDDDFLGGIDCTLGQVVSGSPFSQTLLSKSGRKLASTISILAEELESGSKDLLMLSFRAQHLDNKDFLGKSDPFLQMSKSLPNGNWQIVFRSQVIKNNLNPVWPSFEVSSQALCNGDQNRQIRIQCFDWDNNGGHDLIGEFSTTINEMIEGSNSQIQWPCINPKKKAKKSSYKNSGIITLTSIKITKEFSFLDFIFGGLQIAFTVGIDFTASNGDPRNPQSLHHINDYHPTEYLQALSAVGAVIQDYDSDKMFPALGFGARIPPSHEVFHEFAINFNPSNPYCTGIEGIVDAYKNCLNRIQLYGPTNISPIIYHVSRFAQAAQKDAFASHYFILLILTDGIITDMDNTKTAIVEASHLPMSIIIVGVGLADFSAMHELDGDNGLLRTHNGKQAVRDIVQFVPFSKYKHATAAMLAKEVLAEVPRQVISYYKKHNIPPSQSATVPH